MPVGRSGLPPPGNSDPKPFCARARGLKSPSQLRGCNAGAASDGSLSTMLRRETQAPLERTPQVRPSRLTWEGSAPRCREEAQSPPATVQHLSQNGYSLSLSLSLSIPPAHVDSLTVSRIEILDDCCAKTSQCYQSETARHPILVKTNAQSIALTWPSPQPPPAPNHTMTGAVGGWARKRRRGTM